MDAWTVCVWLGRFGAWEDTLNSRLRGNDIIPAWVGARLAVAPGVRGGPAEHE